MNEISDLISNLNEKALSPLALAFLIISVIFLSFKFKFIQLRAHRFLNKSKFTPQSIKSLGMSLAGTLGVGNISGVALAIALGGAGAVFWMWISAILVMILKYSEVMLTIIHKKEKNTTEGGAMYYIKDTFNNKKCGVFLSCFFSFIMIVSSLTIGSTIQTNAAAEGISYILNIDRSYVGIIILIIVLITMMIDKKKISTLTAYLTSFMTVIFILLSLSCLISKYYLIIDTFELIILDAFSPLSLSGGITGVLFSASVQHGFSKGIFSNEAGCGTTTISHSLSDVTDAHTEGYLGILEVFIDTIFLCTVTALVILTSGNNYQNYGYNSVKLVLDSFNQSVGISSEYILALSIFLFALASIICWAYYGTQCVIFIKKNQKSKYLYLMIYMVSIYLGSVTSPKIIWNIADSSIYLLIIINTFCIIKNSDKIKKYIP